MDEFSEFLLNPKPHPPRPSTSTETRVKPQNDFWNEANKNSKEDKSFKYANKHEDQLQIRLKNEFYYDSLTLEEEDDNPLDPIYTRYNFNFRRKSVVPLPIESYREVILDAIWENVVVVLQGATGCGKTTQVPQYILHNAFQRKKYCKILVAQPRRIATSSNARRVCKERLWPLGGLAGFQIGSDRGANVSVDTRLIYCTTGVLLEKLVHAKSLYGYTHIILDEVHERTKEMDFLMIILKKFMNRKIRIILMSATIDAKTFADYFALPTGVNGRLVSAPIIDIDAEQRFRIKTFYLNDLQKLFGPAASYPRGADFDIERPMISDEIYDWALRLTILFDRVDWREAQRKNISREEYDSQPKPSVLMFLPGINEINVMYHRLEDWKNLNQDTTIVRVVLHSTAAPIQAEVAMQKSDKNIRKIILATNIAESSITVPDVKYVIDFCLTRSLVLDSATNFSSLRLSWASKNNCNQRSGRTGRVMSGTCFRLVTRQFYMDQLPSSSEPEITNNSLEDIILKTKILDMGPPDSILALAMDKPALKDIEKTIYRLKAMGALLRTTGDVITPLDGDITFIGRVMSVLPLDVKLSKLIVLGYCFNVLDECIVIAAALNCTKDLFPRSCKTAIDRYTQMLEWADGSGSDLFAMLNAYTAWQQIAEQQRGQTKYTRGEELLREKAWCDRFGLDLTVLRECQALIKDIKCRLRRLQLIPLQQSRAKWADKEKNIMLKVVIAGAFYPNYFVRSSPLVARNERAIFESLGGRDPCNTVFFTNFEAKYVRHIYVKAIKEIFVRSGIVDSAEKLRVSIENGSQKIFVTFKSASKKADKKNYGMACMPGFVLTEIYKTIKMRQARIHVKFPVLRSTEHALEYALNQNLFIDRTTLVPADIEEDFEQYCYPRLSQMEMEGFITHIEDCAQFYFQPKSECDVLNSLYEELNNEENPRIGFEDVDEIEVGKMIAAPYSDGMFYRGRVVSIQPPTYQNAETKFFVNFLDFGNTEIFGVSDLVKLSGVNANFIDMPPRCFKCSLVGVQPSHFISPNGAWLQKAIDLFREKTNSDSEVRAKIFSICNGIVRVEIFANNVSINEMLIEKKFADRSEENFISKADHMMRTASAKNEATLDSALLEYLREENLREIDPPSHPDEMLTLKGAFTPLEVSMYSVAAGSSNRRAIIDPCSVNSITLENEPSDVSLKYMVAVSASKKREDEMNIRHTTLLPHICGFGALMAALFSPQVRLKRDRTQTTYAAMITGLGFDQRRGRPVYGEGDMVFDLDTEFSLEDFDRVNDIRHCINSLLLTDEGQDLAINFDHLTKRELISNIKDLVCNLVFKPRRMLGIDSGNVNWCEYEEKDVLPTLYEETYQNRAIFPLHPRFTLTDKDLLKMMELKKENQKLIDMSKNEFSFPKDVKCRLCNGLRLEKLVDLRHHLVSRLHKDRVDAIFEVINRTYDF